MQKKYYLLILAFALMLGTIVTALPPTKAHPNPTGVSVYTSTHIYSGLPSGSFLIVEVWIDTPDSWNNTVDGIVGYALSVQVDPRVLEVYAAKKVGEWAVGPDHGGFLEAFLVSNGYTWWNPGPFPPPGWEGAKTTFYEPTEALGTLDKNTGTMLDIAEFIESYPTYPGGAGGGPMPLCNLFFVSKSETMPSVIDIFGPPRPPVVLANASYMTYDGNWHEADATTDGYYIAETPDARFYELISTSSVMGSTWHEVWPEPCRKWTVTSHTDDGATPGEFDVSEQFDMTRDDEYVAWFHVDWVNPDPVPGDGKADLIATAKEPPIPEFPLGLGLMIALAPAIPIVYLWRTRKKER